jgi:hypothetical protein
MPAAGFARLGHVQIADRAHPRGKIHEPDVT